MEQIAVPILLDTNKDSLEKAIASCNIFVNLIDKKAKGIHMSRLHKILTELDGIKLNRDSIKQSLKSAVASQNNLSNSAKIDFSFDVILKKHALLSNEYGYQSYPIKINTQLNKGKLDTEIEFSLSYSSTCPCSASLSRQLYAQSIETHFPTDTIKKSDILAWIQSKEGSIATPHSQRSYAYIKLSIGDQPWPDFTSLIQQFEKSIVTAVQTAVKREDEQAFAKLNAENLMFCEDAARKIKATLETLDYVNDYWLKIEHQESLHDHNAVVIDHS